MFFFKKKNKRGNFAKEQVSKVLVVVITKDRIEPRCYTSILKQDYGNFTWISVGMKPKIKTGKALNDLYENCSFNRNYARQMALASDADYFLFVDSDIILPPTAISEFMLQAEKANKKIMGGYYQIGDGRYAAGKWVADNVFYNFLRVEKSLVRTDMIGMGCAFLAREVVEKIPFESGTNMTATTYNDLKVMLGECIVFGNRAYEHGYDMFVVGEVHCGHIKNGKVIY